MGQFRSGLMMSSGLKVDSEDCEAVAGLDACNITDIVEEEDAAEYVSWSHYCKMVLPQD